MTHEQFKVIFLNIGKESSVLGQLLYYMVTMQTLTRTINVVLKTVTGRYKLCHQNLSTTQLYFTGKEIETQTEQMYGHQRGGRGSGYDELGG